MISKVNLLLALSLTFANIYDPTKSKVQVVSQLNYDKSVLKTKSSTKTVQIIHFYKPNDYGSKEFSESYEKFAEDYQGIFKVQACNCAKEPTVCEKEGIKKLPAVRVIPPQPIPAYDLEGQLETKKILNVAAGYLQSNVIEVNSTNLDTFIQEKPTVPKVLLFTDKANTPTIFKGLSLVFENKLFFGIVRASEEDVFKNYKVKSTPHILVVKNNEKKAINYDGDMKFKSIFEFLNIYSEAFVPGGGSSADSAATKAWLTEMVPELNKDSYNDICFQTEGVLCAIIFSKGKPEEFVMNQLKDASREFQPKIQRGSTFKFMWLDIDTQPHWASKFDFEELPQLIVLNPGKRKRYVLLEGETTLNNIESLLEKIINGDARFKNLPVVPNFV